MTSEFHVATTGSDAAEGSKDQPFRTINRAAAVAHAGDTVVVHAGEYREWVQPRRGGLSDARRITYQAAEGEHVVIKGSERVTGWVSEAGTVWRAEVPNSLFGDFNPYGEEVGGDWIVYPEGAAHKHLGDVYLNGLSFYEVDSPDAVAAPEARTEIVDNWTRTTGRVRNVEQTKLVWHAVVGDETTTIWANFQGADPNAELVEINVRRSVFYPLVPHLDYITVRGFELAQAATPWTPPTADQPGLIGPNWSKGWIIEDNVIHDAKTSAVSIGKEASTGHNYATERGDKPGYQYQLESVFSAQQIGWDKEHIGSHVIRRNTIYDCGQNGIVGHLGCVFSTIEDNHIYNIALKREFYGYEIGGIKLHAAIDVEIRHNRIHDCSLGTWLDWQTQGTRISRNVFYNNSRDIFIEVSHGPYLVEHNVFASPAAIELFSQGGAFISNLICGTVRVEAVMDRATPYHRPHSTQVAGYAYIRAGDDRWAGNLFVGGEPSRAYGVEAEGKAPALSGTSAYDGYPNSFEAYISRIQAQPPGDHQRYLDVVQAVYAQGNVYAAGARPFDGEPAPLVVSAGTATVTDEGDAVYLATDLPAEFDNARLAPLTGRDLERVRFADAEFEERDGTPAVIDVDLLGTHKAAGTLFTAGPIASLASGQARTRIW
ncbi:right-handed parallel beta-helix repeat-containing protein [Paractinoplanes lichenicola]|uniref:Right-handed parallel beta-helix repeat-containing protein n=1 Tax=Paractinoplanes lichenicola TaxID=2802976 RepID=A0ABS1VLW8_9ACTN|nr:right-handed parallel beta-helix repeat-containing protein [Actinoplanes lichenicola]MBL7255598.1 right-handed parallel beta-helix repeat-containing protein [Actinoplanes lichenicola]